jgi:hypothetical protein
MKESLKRSYRAAFSLNEEEKAMIDRYLSRYKIKNRARWYRETVLKHVLEMMERDYPTLFNEHDMRR